MSWTAVASATTDWSDDILGYLFADYVEDGYVVGDEPSGLSWTAVATANTTWTEQ